MCDHDFASNVNSATPSLSFVSTGQGEQDRYSDKHNQHAGGLRHGLGRELKVRARRIECRGIARTCEAKQNQVQRSHAVHREFEARADYVRCLKALGVKRLAIGDQRDRYQNGYTNGKTAIIDIRDTGSDFDSGSKLAEQLIAQRPDVIYTSPGILAKYVLEALTRARQDIPLVVFTWDPTLVMEIAPKASLLRKSFPHLDCSVLGARCNRPPLAKPTDFPWRLCHFEH
jgi:hypothetical protein